VAMTRVPREHFAQNEVRRSVGRLLRGVRGAINEVYLDDLRKKTHRGLSGQIERGYHAGGLSYGYRSVVVGTDARGQPIGHRLEVDSAKAAVVIRIFQAFGAGDSCQRIAATLNAEGVPGPRGTWSVSALFGSPAKGSGVLNNDLYVGRYVWNRSQWIKDPDTRKRQRVIRPREDWLVVERPELRIVTDDAWKLVRNRKNRRKEAWCERPTTSPPRTLFGGLMRCSRCKGPMIAVSHYAYGCANRKDRGKAVCTGTYAPRVDTERRLVGFVRDELLAPEAITEIEHQTAQIIAEARHSATDGARHRDARRAVLEAEIKRLVDAIATIGASGAIAERLKRAEADLAVLDQATPQNISAPDRFVIARKVRETLLDLASSLKEDVHRDRAREALRQVLGEIRIEQEGDAVYANVTARLDRVLLAVGGPYLVGVAGTCNLTQKRIRIK
jgi:site-specific DNA recombinase